MGFEMGDEVAVEGSDGLNYFNQQDLDLDSDVSISILTRWKLNDSQYGSSLTLLQRPGMNWRGILSLSKSKF